MLKEKHKGILYVISSIMSTRGEAQIKWFLTSWGHGKFSIFFFHHSKPSLVENETIEKSPFFLSYWHTLYNFQKRISVLNMRKFVLKSQYFNHVSNLKWSDSLAEHIYVLILISATPSQKGTMFSLPDINGYLQFKWSKNSINLGFSNNWFPKGLDYVIA